MKHTLIALIALLLSAVIGAGLIYPTALKVIDVQGDVVTAETSTGLAYEFMGDGYEVGDIASVIMFTNGTEVVTDDAVIDAQYSGYWFN